LTTLSSGIIILLLYTDCQGGRTAAAIARHVSFAQITCIYMFWFLTRYSYAV